MAWDEDYIDENEEFDPITDPIIDIENLKKSFGDHHVLKGFDLKVFQGENAVVMGRSGVGKSVLIKCMVGLLKPDSGKLNIFGKAVSEMKKTEMDALRRKVGFCFQGNALYDSMTVKENLEFPLRRHFRRKDLKPKIKDMVHSVLENVGLVETMNKMPSELSGGMKKRIALARTLILKPEIILYDEPTSGLDPITAQEISELIVRIQEQNRASSIVITHDIVCAKITASHMSLLVEGTNYANGPFDELKRSEDPNVRAYFSQLIDE